MITKTHHIGVNVTDMEAIIHFYGHILGLSMTGDTTMQGTFLDTVQGKSDMDYRIVKFSTPDGIFAEFLQDRGHETAPHPKTSLQAAGLRHFALETDDVDAFYQRIQSFGCETVSAPCTSEDGSMRLFFVRDPEYNLVEIMQIYR